MRLYKCLSVFDSKLVEGLVLVGVAFKYAPFKYTSVCPAHLKGNK
jgi:hypothetical protein